MPGLCSSNELIARDEGSHCSFAVLLYSMLENKLDESYVHNMFNDAVTIEIEFICSSLPCALIGMNSDLMTQYIKFVADRLLVDLGYNKLFNVMNPFDFMESISIEGKTNFFESRPTQYQNASVLNKSRDSTFDINDDF
jgi:ribonucleotide reductase beta subunit family protein with ferritin-like domain